jgi:DNA repair protein RadC
MERNRPTLHVLDSTDSVYLNRTARGHIKGPTDIVSYVRQIARKAKREIFVAFYLDTRHKVRRAHVISIGSLSASIVHPREVFRPAVIHSAASLIVAHNHPSGEPEPSDDDIEITNRLADAGELLGIPLVDHVIVAGWRHISLREKNLIRTL